MGKTNPGFHPVGTLHGNPWTAGVKRFAWAGVTTVNVGDVVILSTDGAANAVPRENDSNNIFLGAVVATLPVTKQDLSASTVSLSGATTPNLGKKALSAAGFVYVAADPATIFSVETTSTSISDLNIGQTANVVPGADPTLSNLGVSGHKINSTTMGVGSDGAVKIIGRNKNPDAYANTCLVIFNKHIFSDNVAGI